MVTTKQLELHELIDQGIETAKRLNKQILISQVTPIKSVDPLSFFINGETEFSGQRSYWSDTDGTTMAGLGECLAFEGFSGRRFDKIEQKWESFLQHSIIDGLNIKGTGPLLIGGSTFDPLKKKGQVWKAFPDASFVLPKYLLTMNDSGIWLTVNAIVGSKDESHSIALEMSSSLEGLIIKTNQSFEKDDEEDDILISEDLPEDWLEAVRKMASEIKSGKLEKVVLARELTLTARSSFSIGRVISHLQKQQKDSFVFAIERNDSCFLGATPERLIKKQGQSFYTTCLAGSIARGKTAEEDQALGDILLKDPKNLTEHKLVVDMIKSAMENVCYQMDVPEHPSLYKVRDIQHLYTPIKGHAEKETTLFSMIKELHPTPALGGVPREDAMEKIRALEPEDRGWYASPIGWIDYNGDGEFAVAIRSGVINGNCATLYAGCGIVGDSDPMSEYEETKMKFRPMLTAIGGRFK